MTSAWSTVPVTAKAMLMVVIVAITRHVQPFKIDRKWDSRDEGFDTVITCVSRQLALANARNAFEVS